MKVIVWVWELEGTELKERKIRSENFMGESFHFLAYAFWAREYAYVYPMFFSFLFFFFFP